MDGLQAAILSVKLKYLESWTNKRHQAASYYSEGLKDLSDVKIPYVDVKTNPAWHLYVMQAKERDKLSEHLNNNGIATGIHYPIALPNLKAYQYLGHTRDDFPVASSLEGKIISLPIFPEISKEQLDYVIFTIKAFYHNS